MKVLALKYIIYFKSICEFLRAFLLVFHAHVWGFCQVPMARASILWLLGEYCERVPKVAPDVLRKMAKTFGTEVSSFMC